NVANAQIDCLRVRPLRRRRDRLIFKIERCIGGLWRARELHSAPHHRRPDDIPGPRLMRREPDAQTRASLQSRPNAMRAHEEIVREPAPDVGPELPVVLEAHARRFDVHVAVYDLKVRPPATALRVAPWCEIENRHARLSCQTAAALRSASLCPIAARARRRRPRRGATAAPVHRRRPEHPAPLLWCRPAMSLVCAEHLAPRPFPA